MTIDFKDHTYVGGATLKWLLGGSGVAYFTLSRTDSRNLYTEWNNSQERYTTRSEATETGARTDLEVFPLPDLQVMAGLSVRRIEAADHVIELGPGPGRRGGRAASTRHWRAARPKTAASGSSPSRRNTSTG